MNLTALQVRKLVVVASDAAGSCRG